MNLEFDWQRHAMIIEHLLQPVPETHCLIYEDCLEVPASFDEFARNHYTRLNGVAWPDMCPVYAFGLISHGCAMQPEEESDLEMLWQSLPNTNLSWPQARQVVADIWKWRDSLSVK